MSDMYYDRKGQPMTREDWTRGFDMDRRVGEDTVRDQRVSTVWLGLNHSFGEGPPLIFETMIFGGPHDEYQDRYSTEEDALAGHKRVVAALRAGQDPEEVGR